MVSKNFQIKNQMGFHMRPANMFVSAMAKYTDTKVIIDFRGNEINGKSIMNLMAACIKCDAYITVRCDGPEEEAALAEATKMIESGFGE